MRLKTYATFSVTFIHEFMEEHREGRKAALPTGDRVNTHSQRLELFASKGVSCVTCGLTGIYYGLDGFPDQSTRHLNLYALDPVRGVPVLMTKDHILPKSKGGLNVLENYNPMCYPCNQRKADSIA